jgi:hypothetical protein
MESAVIEAERLLTYLLAAWVKLHLYRIVVRDEL